MARFIIELAETSSFKSIDAQLLGSRWEHIIVDLANSLRLFRHFPNVPVGVARAFIRRNRVGHWMAAGSADWDWYGYFHIRDWYGDPVRFPVSPV